MDKLNLSKLTTESRNQNTLNIDKVSTLEMVKMINEEDKKVANAIEIELPQIAEAIDGIVERMQKGGRLIYIGAGTSGRLGILDASECPPTYGVSEELVQGLIAGGQEAIFRAKEGAEDSKELAVLDLKDKHLNENDTVVGIAASGRTPYVIGGLEYANEIGALTISVTCNADSQVAKEAKIAISPVVGAEVVTGSTRLKSGTAQKLVLNMLSTGSMIKMGKVYGNLMVDVKATNEKLVERSKKIVCEATGVSFKEAETILNETGFDVKLSIFMILSNLEKEEAKVILEMNNGYIAKALKNI
ncbi:N-acetylmuramic acid 6-phosphate etherase [Paraclostridium bifermentans]|uniref:N-acetylmuramic acid 6-phosphate etherase n=1 Tax=Paraclostridium bifermentans TaxID=1490 RepID=A0A5P3XIH0_PARBF|nr:N-acetylmuramic acid 6-phosphate etherase [Paraclostridium bifermentans]MDV8108848.1 N-acetylmuramic acid 6-phosphate etherase [Bacillus sp. BAU-SS-2023]EQK45940.1 N-acetylmuramic acid 6-phosphate etherase [[Clostridium] bifermentans ATCC 19299] [Paraclostridium bifermentans ATCC 19299]MCE9675787.1 N-acetylmuramic acid 6-phosphate etherase [Paraclostridium bifermentans]MCR1875464.1 N-acetylmuramic acid 6-phosphate etherase [Paraclostridium bifermentans]QEZ70179.1 N-acetylmuramic acid 6-phos